MIAGATWVGGRRWDLHFQGGETLSLPEGEAAARRALAALRADGPAATACSAAASPGSTCAIRGARYVRISREPGATVPAGAAAAAPEPPAEPPRRPGGRRSDGATPASPRPQAGRGARRRLVQGLRADRRAGRGRQAHASSAPASARAAASSAASSPTWRRARSRSARRSSRPSGSPAPSIDQVFVGFSAGGLVSDVAERRGRDRRAAGSPTTISTVCSTRAGQSIEPDGRHDPPRPAGALHDRRAERRQAAARAPCRQARASTSTSSPPIRRRWKNLDLCVRSAHLGVEAIVASPVAAGKACLSEEERELGVALVELGARRHQRLGVRRRACWSGLKSLSIGGGDITDDIASAFGTRRAEAERIKCFYGSAMTSPRDNHDMIELAPIAGGQEGVESARITRAQLVAVIRQRLERLTGADRGGAEGAGLCRPVRAAGGADRRRRRTEGHRRLCAGRARPRRCGSAGRNMPGLPEAHSGPAFSTLAGPRPVRGVGRDSTCASASARRKRARGESGNWLSAADCGISDSVLTE